MKKKGGREATPLKLRTERTYLKAVIEADEPIWPFGTLRSVMPYSPQVLDHFHHPRRAGEIAQATAIVEAANPVCGDVLKLWANAEGGRIVKVRFKAGGCVPALACGSWLADWLEGKTLARLPALSADEIEGALGGLPAASTHASTLAITALHQLLEKLAGC
jgi:nitrogen fixation NifU-like protein